MQKNAGGAPFLFLLRNCSAPYGALGRRMSGCKKKPKLSPIFENALDSLRIGMEFFQRESSYRP